MENTELKPCPFCGGEAQVKMFITRRVRLFKEVSAKYKYIECKVCGCRTPLELEEQDAIDKWNRRV